MSVFDKGLQPERTALAWRRTTLALFAGSLVATRILPEVLGGWAALLGIAGAVSAGGLLWAVHLRYRRHHHVLLASGDRSPIAGGKLIAATAAFCTTAALITLVIVAVTVVAGTHLAGTENL